MPATVVFPGRQDWHAVPDAYFPTGQSEQSKMSSWTLPPALNTLLPAGQDSHDDPPFENLPASQLAQVDPSAVFPGGQFIQSSTKVLPASDVFPKSHLLQASPAPAYFPGSQGVHSIISSPTPIVLDFPAGHDKHTLPVLPLYFPCGQSLHEPPSLDSSPALHGVQLA